MILYLLALVALSVACFGLAELYVRATGRL